MAELSNEQLKFLRSQKIPPSAMFDASGLKKADYQNAMKAEGKCFCYGGNDCNNGHALKARSGHCIQCDHARIGFMLRNDADAYIYIAASVTGRLIKIGCTIDIAVRAAALNRLQYGGQNDWHILATAYTPAAGKVEFEAHAALSRFNVPGEYVKAGRRQRCYELFRCDFQDAREALTQALGRGIVLKVPNEARAMAAFNFSTQSGDAEA